MKQKPLAVIGVSALLAGGAWLTWNSRPTAAKADNNTPPRKTLELTVYAQDFGMVREQRTVALDAGTNRLHVPDVSRQLDPQSVLLGWGKRDQRRTAEHCGRILTIWACRTAILCSKTISVKRSKSSLTATMADRRKP